MTYNNLYEQLVLAGLPVISADDSGNCRMGAMTSEQEKIFADILTTPTNAQLREREYDKVGATDRARLDALWEKIIEGRPEAADALQVKRLEVKAKYPKPLR